MSRNTRPPPTWQQSLVWAVTYRQHLGERWAINYLLDELEDMGSPSQHAVSLVYAELEICDWETVSLAVRQEEPAVADLFQRPKGG